MRRRPAIPSTCAEPWARGSAPGKDVTGANNTCAFTVSGSAFGTYTNSTGVGSASKANPHIGIVTSGCLGTVAASDAFTFKGPIKIITPTPPPQIHHNST